jgi:hypothetical protein
VLPAPELDAGVVAAISRARSATDSINDLETLGCAVADGLRACAVTIPAAEAKGVPHQPELDALRDLADLYLRFERGPVSFELTATAGSPLEFQNDPAGDPASAFTGEDLKRARAAWEGDIDAATTLPGKWSGNLTIDLAMPFARNESARAWSWRAARTAGAIMRELNAYPWWRARELVEDAERPVVVVLTAESNIEFRTATFAVVSLDRLPTVGLPAGGIAARRVEVRNASGAQLPDGVPLPEQLEPNEGHVGAERLIETLRTRADACAWAWLSNSTTARDDESAATVEYFGYRRRGFVLPPEGYVAASGERASKVYTWATAEASPDRILAIRQVVSLYDGATLPNAPEDVIRAAEPLYLALRAGEVAAVLESQRQTRGIAVEAGRESAAAAQSAAKSAAERTIASLAAVAGIAVANATAGLSAKDARGLTIGIAALFGFLAMWATFIEGPAMRAPISSFKVDLPTIGHLLGPADRTAILGMRALKTASHAVLRARIATPIIYLAGAAVTLLVAHYRFRLGF